MPGKLGAEIYPRRMTVPLDPSHVPMAVRPLIPLAERWGIGDDGYRDQAVHAAAPAELEELLDALAGSAGDAMYNWLAGPAAEMTITDEYAAFTAVSMAADMARVLQKRRRPAVEPDGPAI
jgi:hypothetical protein